jgi:hypothetical protein
MPTPLRVTFDTNTYTPIARPQLSKIITAGWPPTKDRILSKRRRLAWWYIQWCIRKLRIQAGIPEAAFMAEVLPNVSRVDLLLATGTNQARPAIPAGRQGLIKEALELGLRVLHGSRIAYGEVFGFDEVHWAADDRVPWGGTSDSEGRLSRDHFWS